MTYLKRFTLSFFCILTIVGLFGFYGAEPAQAQVESGLNAVGETIVLEANDPRVIAARIINIFLGLVGIILVSLILYAGFLWMTSGGDPEKIERAKAYIRNSIIGLVIVLSSWAIATFVINQLLEATGDGGPGGTSGPGGPGGGLGGGGVSSAFQLRSITPEGEIAIRNVQVRFIFSRSVDSASAAANIEVVRASDGTSVDGTIDTSGSIVTFTPSAACPAPNDDRNCFDANTEFIARADSDLESTGGQSLACGGFAAECEERFTTGDLVDTANPEVSVLAPFNGQNVPVNDAVVITSRATDDAGVSYIETSVDGSEVGTITSPTTETMLEGDVLWDTTGLSIGRHSIQSRAFDIDSNSDQSSTVSVYVRPAHCFNGTQDEDETGLDCGGSCGACAGGSCTSGDECASGVCSGGVCVEQPVITGVSPGDGRPGTLVTLSGANFGSAPGTVTFADGQVATPPAACTAAGVSTWSSRQVIVSVPDAAVNGPIELVNASTTLSDITNNDLGPALDDFEVNDVARPGLCGAVPPSGLPGTPFDLVGAGLGDTSDTLLFNDRELRSFLSWTDDNISLNTPVYTPARYAITAVSGGVESNSVAYRILERGTGADPVIDNISPGEGPVGEYITLTGRNFGTRVGRVVFTNSADEEGNADVDFPDECSVNFWTDRSIVVKVPDEIGSLGTTDVTPGDYEVHVVRQDTAESETVGFTVNSETPRPGICAIRPQAGPTDTEVQIIGERFGSSGTVTFKGPGDTRVEAFVDSGDYTSGQVTTAVPRGSETGSVTLETDGVVSNPVEFTVRNCNEDATICSAAGETCCRSGACSVGGTCPTVALNAQYAWRTSTGPIPINPMVIEECNATAPASPSPWDDRTGGDQVCVNAEIVLRFTTALDDSTVRAGGADPTMIVQRCTAGGDTPCATTDPVGPRAGFPRVGPAGDGTDYITFRPALPGNEWAPNATYQIILRTGISSDTGIPMLEREECGAGNSYCFTFSTRNSTEACTVGSVNVLPDPFTADEIGQTIPYQGFPRAEGDICISLDGSGLNWGWDTDGDGRASITSDPPPDADQQTGTALAETGDVPVPINASVLQDSGSVQGTGDLFIRFVPPEVVDYGPNCDEACVNAAIWAKFNVSMDPATVRHENIQIYRCATENCLTFSPLSPLDLSAARIDLMRTPGSEPGSAMNYLLIEPTRPGLGGSPVTLLEPGRFYKVILRGGLGGFLSQTQLPLVNTNDPLGFSWTFRVRGGDNPRCSVDRVDVTPLEKYETTIGDRQSFVATPVGAPDSCNQDGQPLITDMSFNWSQSDTNVARFIRGGGSAGTIDTTYNLPAGCSDVCLNTGAAGVDGEVANCGNSVIETSNGEYCRNAAGTGPCTVGASGCQTIHGAACAMMPAGSLGAEECDDGAANGAAGRCSAACLWNPVTGGTCGNGVLNPGEQCDVARFCTGGTTPGASCADDADCSGGTCSEAPGCSDACQLMGSRAGGSVCGNGSIGAGEACDDGNTMNGDGCSRSCLHEGSRPVTALCGNGTVEAGEACDGGPNCDPVTCLNTGTDACGAPGDPNCCGNATTDAGEDCDDGNNFNGDGCSARCLAEGSSPEYINPSFCGDGTLGTGEVCEASAPDGLIDPVQLSEIVGNTEPDADGRMQSTLSAEYETKIGEGLHGLQCGFTEEASCTRPGTGLTNNGCCSARPVLSGVEPPHASTGVCRNVMISGVFNMEMDRASLQTNLLVAKEEAGSSCPAGTTPLVDELVQKNGFFGWLSNAWEKIKTFFGFAPAEAQVWCAGEVSGRVIVAPEGDGTRASFQLDNALEANTRYKVVFRGDTDLTNDEKQGIRSARGVVVDADAVDADHGSFTWTFTTGSDICTVSSIRVRDTYEENPSLFTSANEAHTYVADVVSLEPGYAVTVSPVAEYDWTWQSWLSSNTGVLTASPLAETPEQSQAEIESQETNGTSYIFAGIRITNDEVHTPSTTEQVIRSSLLSTVLLCEQPWPERAFAPFSDSDGSASLSHFASPFVSGPWFNFSMLYCKDAGDEDVTTDDLPHADLTSVPLSAIDRDLGILRQYLLTFDAPSLSADGIGIRIVENPLHLSVRNWYASRGFTGSPESTTVDGYEALRDGSTVYVSGANTENSTLGPVYSNIYILSRNPDAKPETQNIFDQLIENFTLNVNIENNAMNVCVTASTDEPYLEDGVPVECTADWECLQRDGGTRCASFKAKLQRDIERIADFQAMTDRLENANDRNASYPVLQDGSFVQTLATSRWPSWQAAFQSEVGASMPTDPVNRFLTCGECSGSGTVCIDDSECSEGETCEPTDTGLDPQTCWNESTSLYHCPVLDPAIPESVSRIYQYRAVDGGGRYELATELEGPAPDRWVPPLRSEVRKCSNIDSICETDADCTVTNTAGVVTSVGTCNPTGGNWLYTGICAGRSYGIDDVCGNGVVGPTEACEIGDTRPVACTTGGGVDGTKLQVCSDCAGFIDGPTTSCVANLLCGNGRVDRAICRTTAGGPGVREGTACRSVGSTTECADPGDPAGTVVTCTALPSPEACDDGALNGTYGRCAVDCSGYDAYCGDGELSPGESCDEGSANGAYCSAVSGCSPADSCSFDCRGRAPYCGDRVVNGPEQCDGNVEVTTSALCQGPTNPDEPCETDADCGTHPLDQCGGSGPFGYNFDSCVGVTVNRCTNVRTCSTDSDCNSPSRGPGECVDGLCRNDATFACTDDASCNIIGDASGLIESTGSCVERETQRIRGCVNTIGGGFGPSDLCTYKLWSDCQPVGVCGDGTVDAGEECDDGNDNNNDACTNRCTNNVCGDGTIYTGVEQCDYGSRNGSLSCRADYGSTCINCSATCQQVAASGGFCGDGVRNGPEQCDGTEGVTGVSCSSLGYDFAEEVECAQYGYMQRLSTGEFIRVCKGVSGDPDAVISSPCVACFGGTLADCDLEWIPPNFARTRINAEMADELCLPDPEPCPPGGICILTHQPRRDVISCNSACGYNGCARCSETEGTETVSGQVFDAIYSNQPVPNARISVFQRGVRLPELETYTDENGRFEISGLVSLNICANYRIIIDSFEDNPCTGSHPGGDPNCNGQSWPSGLAAPNEGEYGGYWSFESGRFGANNFRTAGLGDVNGRIYLAPRVGPGEVTIVHTWSGSLTHSFLDAHLTLPTALTPPTDVYWGGPGDEDIDGADPHAFLACYHNDGSTDCGNFDVAPQTMKYKRGSWGLTGNYAYYIVDYGTGSSGPDIGTWNYFSHVTSVVRVITEERVYTVTPPTSRPTDSACSDEAASNQDGKYWLVYTQNPATGVINIPNGGRGELLCNGSPVYGSLTPSSDTRTLPGPILGPGT